MYPLDDFKKTLSLNLNQSSQLESGDIRDEWMNEIIA